jgi:hypothetical protein
MSSSPAPAPETSFVILWAGEDPSLHSELLEQLDSAGIPYADQSIGSDAVAPTADPLPIDWKPRFGFEVAVATTDLQAARQILEPLLDREPADVELAASEAVSEQVAAAESSSQAPTLEVWSSNAPRLTQFVTDALRENEIPVRAESQGENTVVFVSPACEARAREILREVVEATPPE